MSSPEELLTREELIAMINQMRQRQMTTSGVTIAQAAALQAQRADQAERERRDAVTKYRLATDELAKINNNRQDLTDALVKAMQLIDQMLTELGRLCAAAKEPPPLSIFGAKSALDRTMKKLLEGE